MKLIKLRILGLLFSSLACGNAFAGAEGKGGGDVEYCKSGVLSFFNYEGVSLSDISKIKNTRPGEFDYMSYTEIGRAIRKYLEKYAPEDAILIKEARQKLKFKWSDEHLQDVDTGSRIDVKKSILYGCERDVIAVQNFENHEVDYHLESLVFGLSEIESVMLAELHEPYLLIGHEQGLSLKKAEAFARNKVENIYRDIDKIKPYFVAKVCPVFDSLSAHYVAMRSLSRALGPYEMLKFLKKAEPVLTYGPFEAFSPPGLRQFAMTTIETMVDLGCNVSGKYDSLEMYKGYYEYVGSIMHLIPFDGNAYHYEWSRDARQPENVNIWKND